MLQASMQSSLGKLPLRPKQDLLAVHLRKTSTDVVLLRRVELFCFVFLKGVECRLHSEGLEPSGTKAPLIFLRSKLQENFPEKFLLLVPALRRKSSGKNILLFRKH